MCVYMCTRVRASVCACVCLYVYTCAHVFMWKTEVDAEHFFSWFSTLETGSLPDPEAH